MRHLSLQNSLHSILLLYDVASWIWLSCVGVYINFIYTYFYAYAFFANIFICVSSVQLEYDVLEYVVIERLAQGGRDKLKEDGLNVSDWLQSLASFWGHLYVFFVLWLLYVFLIRLFGITIFVYAI